jgi:hypothetical protein
MQMTFCRAGLNLLFAVKFSLGIAPTCVQFMSAHVYTGDRGALLHNLSSESTVA